MNFQLNDSIKICTNVGSFLDTHFKMKLFIIVFLLLLSECPSSFAKINVVFTVKNLMQHQRLKSNLVTMLQSMLEHTSKDDLQFYVIGDAESQTFAEQTLKSLHYPYQVRLAEWMREIFIVPSRSRNSRWKN